jgi:CRP-like cAMP-binding protein
MLAQHPFFAGLDGRHLRQLAGCATSKTFGAHEPIFREGEEAATCYLITKGAVALETAALGCEALQIQRLGAGEVLGWSWLLPPYQWHFSARATQPTQALALDGKALRGRCEEDHDLGYELLKRFAQVIAQRLTATRMRLLHIPDPRPAEVPKVPPGFFVPEE